MEEDVVRDLMLYLCSKGPYNATCSHKMLIVFQVDAEDVAEDVDESGG